MAPINRNSISLYEDAKATFISLLQQTAQVGAGLIIMLLMTGGNPPGFIIGLNFCLGVGFVAWNEKNRLEKLTSSTSISNEKSFAEKREQEFTINLKDFKAMLKHYIPKNLSPNKRSILETKINLISVTQSSLEDVHNVIKAITESSTNNFLELAKISGLDIQKDLAGAPLSATDLTEIDLSGANLHFVDLRGANLSHTNLSNADLRESHIMNANLNRVNLSYANLDKAILNDSDLTNANLKGASLQGASLIEAELINVNLSKMNLCNVNLKKAKLRGSILSETNLENSIFIEADLTEVDLSKANVKNAKFGNNAGISPVMKRDLIARGAIFEDLSTANVLN